MNSSPCIQVQLTPRSSRTRLISIEGASLKIAVSAAPVDGQANRAVVEFVADLLGVAKSTIVLVRGERSRNKVLLLEGLSVEVLQEQLDRLATATIERELGK